MPVPGCPDPGDADIFLDMLIVIGAAGKVFTAAIRAPPYMDVYLLVYNFRLLPEPAGMSERRTAFFGFALALLFPGSVFTSLKNYPF